MRVLAIYSWYFYSLETCSFLSQSLLFTLERSKKITVMLIDRGGKVVLQATRESFNV